MASIADQILIKMGLDASQLEAGLNRSKQQIGATTQAMDNMGAKWASTAKMLATTVLAPIAGFMSLGAVIKSYFGGVAQVAQLTGAYSSKMEEWRKKRAMLARYNREDIELYKKGREAVTKFQITMDDLSAKIMRGVSPAIKWLIDKLNDFSNWIDRNQNNIIRFFSVVAGTITALLIPSFIKLGISMLLNPLTWIIGLLGVLILIIDDLVTYLRGGDSALGAFWKPLIEYTKTAWEWITQLYNAFVNSEAWQAFKTAYAGIFSHLFNGINQLWNLITEFIATLTSSGTQFSGWAQLIKGIFTSIGGAFETVIGFMLMIWGALISVFTGDTSVIDNAWKVCCDGLKTTFNGVKNTFLGIIQVIKDNFNGILDTINNLIDAILNFGTSIAKALNIDGLVDKAKEKLTNILPDWVKSSLGINEEGKQTEQPTIYAGTDAPIVPDVQNMQAIKAQSKGNVNNNINRSQVFNIGSNNPAVVTATIREADYEMTSADRAIAMASQSSGW